MAEYQGIVPYLLFDDAGRRCRSTMPVDDAGRRCRSTMPVDDVDAVHKHVQAAGVECEAPVDREFGVRMLNVPDGMGYLWGFMRRTQPKL